MKRLRSSLLLAGAATLVLLLATACPDPTVTTTVPVNEISLNEYSVSLLIGQDLQLTGIVSPAEASDPSLLWSSDTESVATVSAEGLVTAVAPGTAIITASADNGAVTATCTITVQMAFTVSFDTNGGTSSIDSQTVVSGGKARFPGAPSRDGYGFAGWYADAELTDDWNFSTDTVTEDLTLYVKWNLSVYNIVYNVDGGTLTGETTSYTIESADITLVEPTKAGSVFAGWYEDSGFAGEAVTVIHAGSFGYKEYYAKWLAN